MAVELRDHVDEKYLSDLMGLYRQTYWARDRQEDDVRRMLRRTDLVFALIDLEQDKLVGFARVLTDTVYKAFIFDVIVHSDHQGSGLSRMLLEAILASPDLKGVKHFELYCRPDVVDLYSKFGFSTELGGQVFMRKDGNTKG